MIYGDGFVICECELNTFIFSIIEYNKILEQPGDSLYMRAMFDRDQEQDGELSFKKDDILYVDNTMYNGKRGTWRAWLVDDEGSKLRCGTIPSKSRYVNLVNLYQIFIST